MNEMDIQFYGERGIVNGILLDIYRDDNPKDKLDKFFGAIKLMDGSPLPWKGSVDKCKWLVEPCLAQFGNPDFIAVLESQGKKFALFFEAKLKSYEECALPIEKNMLTHSLETEKKYKHRASRINIQLWHRYRFVRAFLATKESGTKKLSIEETGNLFPDGRKRMLKKPYVVNLVYKFLDELKELDKLEQFYFIALTNDQDCDDPWKDISADHYPPHIEKQEKTSHYGLLTYAALERSEAIKANQGYYGSAKSNINLNLPGSLKAREATKEERKQIKNITGKDFMGWDKKQYDLAKQFLDIEIDSRFQEFKEMKGSYSWLAHGQVEVKLMVDPIGSDKLMIGFRSENGINKNLTENITPVENRTPVLYSINGRNFFFYSFDKEQTKNMQNLALQYMDLC